MALVVAATFGIGRSHVKKLSGHAGGNHRSTLRAQEFENFDDRVIEAYREWGRRQPDQNAPAIGEFSGKSWSVSELVTEIERRTPFGQREIDNLREFAKEYPDVGVAGVIKLILHEPLDPPTTKCG